MPHDLIRPATLSKHEAIKMIVDFYNIDIDEIARWSRMPMHEFVPEFRRLMEIEDEFSGTIFQDYK